MYIGSTINIGLHSPSRSKSEDKMKWQEARESKVTVTKHVNKSLLVEVQNKRKLPMDKKKARSQHGSSEKVSL